MPIATDTAQSESGPRPAGEGSSFVVLWQQQTSTPPADIYCASAQVSGCPGGVLTVGSRQGILTQPTVDEVFPAVDFARDKYILSWADDSAGNYNTWMMGLSLSSCLPCERSVLVDGSGTSDLRPRIAAMASSSTSAIVPDAGLIVWHSCANISCNPPGDIKGQLVEAVGQGGPVINLGGGCGAGGTIIALGPVAIGNPFFGLGLSGADVGATTAVAIIGAAQLNLPCGACTLRPVPLVALSTGAVGGSAQVTVPIPCTLSFLGVTLYTQWLVFPI
jgi:hypothetical protein